ncbi:MAG: hypothetical protein JW862_03685 [Anaerolineales bacterium]|nr:hypothetical protein [Anaerolineales bacterium]
MTSEAERAKILEMIAAGTISAEEGLHLINALDEAPDEFALESDAEGDVYELPDPLGEQVGAEATWEHVPAKDRPQPPPLEEIQRWKRWWVIPFWIGVSITVIGAALMFWAYSAQGFSFWFACTWFPFMLGVAAMALAWASRKSAWLHVRVQQKPGESPQRIAISFPLPLRLSAWVFRTFGHHIPHMDASSLDEVLLALGAAAKDGTPFYVDVDEGEDGEKVQVFIG